MTNTKRIPSHHDGVIYDANDNALFPAILTGNPDALRRVARDIATKRGEPVYAYLGNGREFFEPAPAVGMGCTIVWMLDRHAATVIAVSKSGNKVTVREDRAIRTDDNGMSQCQSYTFEPNPEGVERVFYRQGDGSYKARGTALTLGVRNAYRCYEF